MKGYSLISYFALLFFAMAMPAQIFAQSNPPDTGSHRPTVSAIATSAALSAGMKINYVRTREAIAPINTAGTFDTANYLRVKEASQYIDGLGRPMQTVVKQGSPALKDIVSPVVYDAFGRESYKYLPYVSAESNGSFKLDPLTAQTTFMASQYSGESIYYSQTLYEASPLNRIVKSMAPGNSWADTAHGIKMQYLINDNDDSVRIWTIANDTLLYTGADSGRNIPVTASIYPAGQLYETHTTDEQGMQVVEYKDKNGKILLRKVQINTSPAAGHYGWLCTYYIYDDFGLLRFVIPPKATEYLTTHSWTFASSLNAVVAELCFRYEFDARDRMIGKKVPGAEWVYMVYDRRDRLSFTQDANMRVLNHWMANIYDEQNRPVATGMITFGNNRSSLQWILDYQFDVASRTTVSVNFYAPDTLYINNWEVGRTKYRAKEKIIFTGDLETDNDADFETFLGNAIISTTNILQGYDPLPPSSSLIALTVNYYDDYAFTAATFNTINNAKLDEGANRYVEALPATASLLTRGMQTGSKIRVINNPDSLHVGNWVSTASFFDDKGRAIQSNTENYRNGIDISTMRYDFRGMLLTSYQVHNNAAAGQTVKIKTNMRYDVAGRLLDIRKTINDTATNSRFLARNEYDELGQLLNKKLGQKSSSDDTEIELQAYDYNIRGWLKGINKAYTGGTGTKWFGMELSYDYGFATNQLNGNIAGAKWRTKGDGEQRAFGYLYDAANRIIFADFKQYTGGWNNTAGLDFTALMGDGLHYDSAYDANGNILKMKQKGWKSGASNYIDNLTYTYENASITNKLASVTDAVTPDNKLGDFFDANTTGDDYAYDANGNLLQDKNKSISNIVYNHLNLPAKISIRGKGTVMYAYDATGNKVENTTYDSASSKTTITTYLNGYVYQNDTLQFFGHEEGRIRKKPDNSFVYDYFLKDHLGNTRMVLTEEVQQDTYPVATLEDGATTQEGNYYNITSGNIVDKSAIPGYSGASDNSYTNNNGNPPYNSNPTSVVTATSNKMYKLNGATGDKTGLGITLKVMSGDNVAIYGRSFWQGSTPTNSGHNIAVADLLTLLSATGAVVNSGKSITSSALTGSSVIVNDVTNWLNDSTPNPGAKPKAYINWILFNEQFQVVKNSSGFSHVGNSGAVYTHPTTSVDIVKNGYLYIYCSNESDTSVYFDNLQVIHNRGPLLEETHYYPFGLTMAGISSKAAGKLENRFKYNGNKLESGEFSDGSGLEMYDFNARTYDQQIGRFMQVDPELEDGQESWTPYHFGFNNPPLHNDPDGKNPWVWGIRAFRVMLWVVENAHPVGRMPSAASIPTVLKDGTSVVKTVMDLKTLKEVKADAQAENKEAPARGSNNEKTSESAKTGQEAHRQEQGKLREQGAETEVPMTLKDGTQVRKDAVREDGTTVIIKPDTKSGRKSADKREKLMQDNGHKTEKIFYDPKDPKYQPNSPTYIGPRKVN
jgi:RHS repeat-associated protein